MILKTAAVTAAVWSACAALRGRMERARPTEGAYVRLRPLRNRGAAFGLPVDPQALKLLSAGCLLLALKEQKKHPAAVGLILGGGFSNLRERAERGEVLDYLQFPRLPGALGRYVYNLADLAIFTGGICLLADPPPR